MIYVTGDLHGPIDIHKLKISKWTEQKNLTKKDYLVVCGDFGLIWNKSPELTYWLDWLEDKTFTTLFVDGNHENFDMLNKYNTDRWCGGNVHMIRPSVIHLMRGQVFDICGKRVFTMGGASSHDKEWRVEGKSWWKEELPLEREYVDADNNLNAVNRRVDLIFSHCCPTSLTKYNPDKLTDYLQYIKRTVDYDKWFFGHYHVDEQWGEKEFCLYNSIIEV